MSEPRLIVAQGVIDKHPSEVLALKLDLTRQLETGESLTGTPTGAAEAGSSLTVDTFSISGKKVIFKCSAGVPRDAADEDANTPWDIMITVSVTGGPFAQTFVIVCRLRVTTG